LAGGDWRGYGWGMVKIDVRYEGDLHTVATHGPSGATLSTDAPVDNQGRGEAFSPTDLLATALATCVVTTMGIVAKREGIEMAGASAVVTKEMTASGPRRVARLTCTIQLPKVDDDTQRQKLTNAAHSCPVHRSLHPDVAVEIVLNWG
jgi:putative redox protein